MRWLNVALRLTKCWKNLREMIPPLLACVVYNVVGTLTIVRDEELHTITRRIQAVTLP
jgi:hypothetical protein